MDFRLFFYLICLTLLFGCEKNSVKEKGVFRYNEHKNISSLDPAFSKDLADIWATNQLFNGLVQLDDSLKVIASIAKSWTIAENAKEYRFTLRPDVFFHKHQLFGKDSTRHVIASDFAYSFDRLRNKSLASPGSWVMNKVDHYEAINDSVFTITLKQPFPAFLGLLTMKYCSVVPKEILEHYRTDFRSNPIGTGPFKLKRWEENVKLVLRKNNQYFEVDSNGTHLPYLESVAITFLPDKQSEFLQFIQGNLDFLNHLDDSYKDEILNSEGFLRPQYSSVINMQRAPYLNTEYLGFYLESEIPEAESKWIREAINISFDRRKMMTYLRNGIGIPAEGGFIPKGLPGYNNQIVSDYNPKRAKELVDKFRNKTGILNPSISLTTTNNYLSFCEYIQREAQKVGLNITIDVVPASTLKDAKANGKLNFFRASWIADYPDAENYLSLFYSKNFAPNGPNYTHFDDKKFDSVYDIASLETDDKKRIILYSEMDKIIMQESPVVVMFYDEVIRFSQKGIEGLGINSINLLNLKYVQKFEN